MTPRAVPVAYGAGLGRAWRNLAPGVAVSVFLLASAAIIWAAGSTLGYDYEAYAAAARRALDGRPLYDLTTEFAVGFALFLYPPPFAVALIPFALLPSAVGLWLWLGVLVGATLAGVALMPVRLTVRIAVLALAALSWPVLSSIKLGQVTPLLFLLFVAGWRGIDRPAVSGLVIAAGALIKVQPALFFGWSVITRRWRALAVGVGLVAGSVALFGPAAFGDYAALVLRINKPVTTPHNFTPGALAFQAGVGEGTAAALEWLAIGATLAICVWGWLYADATSSYVATVSGSQLISPVLWDHYAMLLLIPTALLLQRGHWWAVAVPLLGWFTGPVYPVLFVVCLVAPILTGSRRHGGSSGVIASSA